MSRQHLLIALTLAASAVSVPAAQIVPPVIQWQRTFGGTNEEWAATVRQTADSGYVVGCTSSSPPSGNKTSTRLGDYDVWLLRLDPAGTKLWERCYGGNGFDSLISIELLGGRKYCIRGVVRTDATGVVIWDRSFGGSSVDYLRSAAECADGALVLSGESGSQPGGTKTSPSLGGDDLWLVKLDAAGNQCWDISTGGAGVEADGRVRLLPDGRRLNASGEQLWQLALRMNTNGNVPNSVCQTSDGGFMVAGHFRSAIGSPIDSDLSIVKLGPDPLTAPQLRAVAQTAESIRTSGFRLELRPQPNAPTNAVFVLEASTNMMSWTPIQTNRFAPGASVIEFVDTGATNLPTRFFRARMEP